MRAALLEIDWQNWILDPGHDPCSAARGRELRLLFGTLGLPVLSTRSPDADPDGPRSDPERRESAFATGFEPMRRPVVTKRGRDVFEVEQIEGTLRGLGVEEVVLTGLLTGHGVRLAAESARRAGFSATVVADACADTAPAEHARALDGLRAAGIAVCTAAELSDRLRQASGRSGGVGIAEAAALTGLSPDTLRWYEREGLIPRVERGRSGHRRYDPGVLRSIQMLLRLRRTGMPVARMRRYMRLVEAGDPAGGRRLELLLEHREEVRRRMRELAEDLAVLDHKIDGYRRLAEDAGTPTASGTETDGAGTPAALGTETDGAGTPAALGTETDKADRTDGERI